MTPAQASGRYDFVTDVPVQGPTDEGIRAADCWWVQNTLPVSAPECVDCYGTVPIWANEPTAWNGGWPDYGGNGGANCSSERVSIGGCRTRGFSLDGPGDPAAALSSDQQAWVVQTLSTLNQRIVQASGTSCAGWQEPSMNLAAAVACFQGWYTMNAGGGLRTDGVLDQDTLVALQRIATTHSADFPTPYPAAAAPATPAAPPPTAPASASVPTPPPMPIEKAGLSRNAKIGIGVAGAVFAVGAAVAATRMGKKKP